MIMEFQAGKLALAHKHVLNRSHLSSFDSLFDWGDPLLLNLEYIDILKRMRDPVQHELQLHVQLEHLVLVVLSLVVDLAHLIVKIIVLLHLLVC